MPITGTSLQAYGGVGVALGYRSGTFGAAKDGGWAPGYQLNAGLEYPTSPFSKIRLGYSYTQFEPLKYDFPVGTVKVDTKLHAFTLGYPRSFGSGFGFDGYNPTPNVYQTGTGRWVSGVDLAWTKTSVRGPDFSASGDGASAGVFGGYHQALAFDNRAGIITWGRLEGGSTEVLGTKFEHKVDRASVGLLYRTVPVM